MDTYWGVKTVKIKYTFITLVVILITGVLSSCAFSGRTLSQSQKVNERFVNVYECDDIDSFCLGSSRYALAVFLKETKVIFEFKKDDIGNWNGTLSLLKNDDVVEEIAVSIDNNEILIHSASECRVSMDLLFFRQFDTRKLSILRSSSPIDMHEEVEGQYPIAELQAYLISFYEEIISNLNGFSKDDFFSAISVPESFIFVRDVTQTERQKHTLTFGFSGDGESQWNPNYYGFERVSMLFYELVDWD
jgi:hypothetical protein